MSLVLLLLKSSRENRLAVCAVCYFFSVMLVMFVLCLTAVNYCFLSIRKESD